jgi:hypothetical protein
MSVESPRCVACNQSGNEIPLLALKFQEEEYWICPQHLPVLIHRPDQLIGKLPGAERLTPHEH